MNGWIKSIVGYMLVVSVAMQMLPGEKYGQYVKLFTGFLLLLLALSPILRIRSADSFLEKTINEFVEEQEMLERQIGAEAEEFQRKSDQLRDSSQEKISVRPVETVEVVLDE